MRSALRLSRVHKSFPNRNPRIHPSTLHAKTSTNKNRLSFGFLAGSFLIGCGLAIYIRPFYTAFRNPVPTLAESIAQNESLDLNQVWKSKFSHQIDDGRDFQEWLSGITALRKKLCSKAVGNVLESAAGTGKNIGYYIPGQVQTLTLVDVAPQFLETARDKWHTEKQWKAMKKQLGIKFLVGDLNKKGAAHNLMLRDGGNTEHATNKYDTIVQTMGLCSTKDPVFLLKNLEKLVKPGGKILLLEHGRSWSSILNRMLDSSAYDHARLHGCWWNRDMEKIVKESGLEIEEFETYWFGAFSWIILRPSKELD